jgi:DnaJ-class molecular chaperone
MSTYDERAPADLYAILGLTSGASAAEITAAYRRLARTFHPDSAQNDPDAHALQAVVAAHRILSDPERRRDYDDRGDRRSDRRIPVPRDRCRTCNGTGRVRIPCRRCAGHGFVLLDTAWLRTPVGCASCTGRGYLPARCAACAESQRPLFDAT